MWLNTQGVLVPSFPDFMVNFNNWQGLFQIRFVPNFRNCLIGYHPKNDLFYKLPNVTKKIQNLCFAWNWWIFFLKWKYIAIKYFYFHFLFSAFGWNFAPKQDNGSSHPLVWWRNSQCIQMVGFLKFIYFNLSK